MDASLLRTPLLGNDDSMNEMQFCNQGLDQYDESSSGYESSDLSDTESGVIPKPRAGHIQHSQKQMTAKFQSTQALSNDLQLILDMPEMCDVTFLVGPDGIPVHGIRAILATRSRVFYQLILKHLHIRQTLSQKARKQGTKVGQANSLTDRLTIPVRKYDADVFRMIIQFVHSGSVAITDGNVVGLLCGSVQFQLTDLQCACWNYISGCLVAPGCGEDLLPSTRVYSKHHAVALDIIDKIYSAIDHRQEVTCRLESTV